MKTLKAEIFSGRHPKDELIEFVNQNNIKREDILIITPIGLAFTLFYCAE